MSSPVCEQAILDALRVGKALLKFISPNDVGTTGSHQSGYYLPKKVWELFTPQAPVKGINHNHPVEAIWQDGLVTQSTVKWYGKGTRAEYRITGFGKGFPFLTPDCVGNLLVLIPERPNRFLMYVFDLEADIEDVQAGLGVDIVHSWAVYDQTAQIPPESEDDCIDRHFREFSKTLTNFPPTLNFALEARKALENCVASFMTGQSDASLVLCVEAEYRLFKMVERKVCESEVVRVFRSIDDFLETAQSILQRRKARAGRSLEHHVEYVLKRSNLPFESQIEVDGTQPDIIIPGKREYADPRWPTSKLFVLGIKTTCKDRWRQVTNEAPRIPQKHILTLQQGISSPQLVQMKKAKVSLVVPKDRHKDYPKEHRHELLTIEAFITQVKEKLAG